MAESDDEEQRAQQERLRLKQSEGSAIGPERAQFWNIAPKTERLQVVPTLPGARAAADELIEKLTRSIDALCGQVAENTKAIAELKKAIDNRR